MAFANSLFHTNQRQAGVVVGGGNSNSMALPFISIPDASRQEPETTSFAAWSCNTQDDPYELTGCSQSSIKSRKSSDNADCDEEADLQGLVSNILDEADSQGNHFNQGSLPICNSIWSPKTLREELLQYFQSEANMQHNPCFPPNQVSHETFSKTQQLSVEKDVGELSQQSNDFATNQEWLFNLPNGDSYCRPPQKLPPVLPMPKAGSTYPPQIQPVSLPAYNDRGIGQPMNNFINLSDIFRPQSEMSSTCFEPLSEDLLIQSSVKPNCNEQYAPEDINQLVSSFQSFMADSICRGDFPNMHKQALGMHHENSMAEEWKITSPAMSTQNTPAMQMPKQLVGEFRTVQRERNEGVRKQIFKREAFRDLSDFTPQNTESFQQSSQPFNLQNPYLNKMTMHRENINVSMNQYQNHHIQQSQIQNKIKPEMQKEKRMHMSGVLGESFSRRPQTNAHMREGDKQHLSQNPHFDFQGSMQSQRFDGENSILNGGNVHQVMPFMYPVNDLRRQPSMTFNSNFSSRSTVPYGSGVHGANVGDMSANESPAFNSYVGDIRTHRGESTCHVPASAMTTSVLMNQGGPVIQPWFYLDECYEQWRCLEKERKKIEVILNKTFFGKRPAAVTNIHLPKTPPNPTRIDHLIVNQTREQAKVESLLERMECLCSTPLHSNIHTALKRHHMAICITQARCMEDTANMTKHQRQKPHFTEDRDTLLTIISLKDLAATTRKLRTALWCALQMTLPKPVKMQDHHVNKEDASSEKCFSAFEITSFHL